MAQALWQSRRAAARRRKAAPSPKILFADEPTGNLDARNGDQIMDLLFTLHKRHGTTLMLITHDQRLAARCGRVISMEDGRIVRAPSDLESVA